MATWQNVQSGFIRETHDDTPPEPAGWVRIHGALEAWEPGTDPIRDEEAREQLDYLAVGD